MTLRPSGEQVMVAWLKTVPGLDPTKVATSVPGDTSAWAGTGFVQVLGIGGAPNMAYEYREPVFQISCWAVSVNSQNAPWGRAAELAERVWHGLYQPELFPSEPALPAGYAPVRVVTGWPMSEPRKILGDEAGFAHVTFDVALKWVIR